MDKKIFLEKSGRRISIKISDKEVANIPPSEVANYLHREYPEAKINYSKISLLARERIENSLEDLAIRKEFQNAPEPAIFEFNGEYHVKQDDEEQTLPNLSALVEYVNECLVDSFESNEIFFKVNDLEKVKLAISRNRLDYSVTRIVYDREYC